MRRTISARSSSAHSAGSMAMPNLWWTQPLSERRPQSARRNSRAGARSTFWIERGGLLVEELLEVIAAELELVAVGAGELPEVAVLEVELEPLVGPARRGPARSIPTGRRRRGGSPRSPRGSARRAGARPGAGDLLGVLERGALEVAGVRARRPAAGRPTRRSSPRRSRRRGTGRPRPGPGCRSSPGSRPWAGRPRAAAGGTSRSRFRCSSMTSSYSSRFLRMSKFRSSTFFWAPSIRRLTIRLSIASPSSMPSRVRTAETHSPANFRIRSSSSERKNRDEPGSPWRPARPRSWLSIRRLSCRSVPMMCRPPTAGDLAALGLHLGLVPGDGLLPDLLGDLEAGRVERPAVLVGQPLEVGPGHELGVAAEDDVGAAAGHVGGDRDGRLAGRPAPRSRPRARGTWRSRPGARCRTARASRRLPRTSRSRSCRPGSAARSRGPRGSRRGSPASSRARSGR